MAVKMQNSELMNLKLQSITMEKTFLVRLWWGSYSDCPFKQQQSGRSRRITSRAIQIWWSNKVQASVSLQNMIARKLVRQMEFYCALNDLEKMWMYAAITVGLASRVKHRASTNYLHLISMSRSILAGFFVESTIWYDVFVIVTDFSVCILLYSVKV